MEVLNRLLRRAAVGPRGGVSRLASLPCALGRHRPAPHGRWNAGYGFTRCERCGRDMVRSLLDGWRVPKGHRVVWRSVAVEEAPPDGVSSAGEPPTISEVPPAAEAPPDDVKQLAEVLPEPAAPLAVEPAAEVQAVAEEEAEFAAESPVLLEPFDFSDFDEPAPSQEEDLSDAVAAQAVAPVRPKYPLSGSAG